MNTLPTLGGLLTRANARYRLFDMGRRVTPLPIATFQQVEAGERPYPYPLQRQAWLGVLFWDRDAPEQHFVWFLRFPLDERGLLQPAARDDFLNGVLQTLAKQQHPDCRDIEALPPESPYAFKPAGERLAMFHALALQSLKLPPSRYYPHARDYLAGESGYDQWAFVGLQGLADVVARAADPDNRRRLAQAIPHLPGEPLAALCRLLENRPLHEAVLAALYRRLAALLEDTQADPALLAALLRSLGASPRGEVRQRAYRQALQSHWRHHLEVLVAISGRGWEALFDDDLRQEFLEALAACEAGDEVFAPVVADLLFVPGLRGPLLESFRLPDRTPRLAQAIGRLLGGLT
ncbi:MAG: DUF3549 family protein [Gammaproteobacteria bacterium]